MLTPTDTLPKGLRPDFPPNLHGSPGNPILLQKHQPLALGPAEIFLQGQSGRCQNGIQVSFFTKVKKHVSTF